MYTTMDKLEEVKIVKGHGDEEIIYKVKNSKEDIFVIIMEYICDFRKTLGKPRLFNSRDERVRILDYFSKAKIHIPKDFFKIFI